MKEKIRKIITLGIDSDTLKIIAVTSMLLDHIAYYFYDLIPNILYVSLRILGRLAMPIFTYQLVQGFFNTKNYNKYLKRIGIYALVTQILITLVMVVNIKIFSEYKTNIYTFGNILISFFIILILLKIIHEPILFKKLDKSQNIIMKIIAVLLILGIYIFVPLDYGISAPILAILIYMIEKFRITVLISKNNISQNFTGLLYKSISENTVKIVYISLILFSLILCVIYCNISWIIILSIIPIMLYNGERKNADKKCKMLFYMFYPAHNVLLYITAMLVANLKI
ncbi:MAG: hypothetical protein IKV94_04400 [Clostridia bacterium]|nr:hypothetical protein [Clostridia bacterium]